MKTIKIIRKWFKPNYTIGYFYWEDQRICNTLEDKDRGLDDNMSFSELRNRKIYGKTAIPTGEYIVSFDIVPKWSSMRKFTVCKEYNYRLPHIKNIKCYDGVYIHSGNDENDSLGCPLVGENKVVGQVINSQKMLRQIMDLAKANNFEDVKLIIERDK